MKRTWPERLFAALIPDGYADQFFADLEEEYRLLAASRGVPFARRWYLGQLVRSLPSLLAHELGGGGKLYNYLAAALRNLARNRLYAGINIAGLTVGFAAAILIALFVRDEFSYDKWIPGHERIYLLTETMNIANRAPMESHGVPVELAGSLKLDFPAVEAVARLSKAAISLRQGDIEANETLYWADPEIFDVLPLPAVAGDLKTALSQPDGLVITRRIARKYFGDSDPLGETMEINREHPMKVTAVLEDLPSNTHLTTEIFASGLASFSYLTQRKANPLRPFAWVFDSNTYLKLASGASAEDLEREMPSFLERHMKMKDRGRLAGITFDVVTQLTPITQIRFRPDNSGTSMKPISDPQIAYALSAIGVLILTIAGINFVNLMTARAARRAIEVGVRKVSGAARRDLIVQFMGESLIYVGLGMIVAMAVVELLLPGFNALLDRAIVFDFWRDPMLIGGILGVVLAVGIVAGFYPAFVLSAFKPAAVLKGGVIQATGSGAVRQSLVTLQFAILVGLIVSVVVIYRQSTFALNEGLRFDKDQVVLVETQCKTAFAERVRALPGVRAAACSYNGVSLGSGNAAYKRQGGEPLTIAGNTVDFGYLELYGMRPLAGRFLSRDYARDSTPLDFKTLTGPNVVINETAVRRFGFASPEAAIGQTLTAAFNRITPGKDGPTVEIVGVVPDFSFDSIHSPISPGMYSYFDDPSAFRWLNIKLAGGNLPETLKAIDALWKETGEPRPITRLFLDQELEKLYLDIIRQSQLFAAFASVALFIACLGLFGLASFTAERRTKEIGIRKAMGANRWDIVKLLVWQFIKPVLLANLIAWPVGYYFMNRWLHGFAYHVDLSPWVFIASGASALVIALATVSVHAFIVAGARPVTALRYE